GEKEQFTIHSNAAGCPVGNPQQPALVGSRQSRWPANPHFPLPTPVQVVSPPTEQSRLTSPAQRLFSLSRKSVKAVPSGLVRSPSAVDVHMYLLSTSCGLATFAPPPASFFF